MRWLYTVFWLFIGIVLLLQFHSYNNGLDKAQVAAGPRQQHFYFYPSHQTTSPVAPKKDNDDVQQVGTSVDMNTPSPGNFTYHVILRNKGTMKAVNVQVLVYPYRGSTMGNIDRGGAVQPIDDSNPLSQTSQSVTFPDLAPGESATRDAVFLSTPGYNPGENPQPQITFQIEKP